MQQSHSKHRDSCAEAPLVSIVMLCWNRMEDVRESLTRINQIEYANFETIVVDNGSSDGTPEMVRDQFPHVQLIESGGNIGIEGYNLGFKAARGAYIVIIDDDSFPEKNALTRMVQRFEADAKLGLIAFDVRNFYTYDQVSQVATVQNLDQPDYLVGFNGAGAGVRRTLFAELGYYPGEFFLYQNELDVALKVWDRGYQIKAFPDIVSYHKFSPVNRASWRAPYFYIRNIFWVVWKHFPLALALTRTAALVYACLFHALEQRTGIYLKAMWHAFRDAGPIFAKRKPIAAKIVKNFRISYRYFFTFYR